MKQLEDLFVLFRKVSKVDIPLGRLNERLGKESRPSGVAHDSFPGGAYTGTGRCRGDFLLCGVCFGFYFPGSILEEFLMKENGGWTSFGRFSFLFAENKMGSKFVGPLSIINAVKADPAENVLLFSAGVVKVVGEGYGIVPGIRRIVRIERLVGAQSFQRDNESRTESVCAGYDTESGASAIDSLRGGCVDKNPVSI